MREQYKAQKEEEETKRQFYHSPDTARREEVEESESSGGMLEDSTEIISHLEQTPEPSPALDLKEIVSSRTVAAPKTKMPPQVAPRPSGQPRVSPSVPQANGGKVGPPVHNPYPAPAEPAPLYPPSSPRDVEMLSSPKLAPPTPTEVAPPTSPDKEALFAFAWYHGSIPRDEALRRLEGVGGYDG